MTRLVLAPPGDREGFHHAALAAGWGLYSVSGGDGYPPYTEVWTEPRQRTAAHYVEDDLLGAAYVELEGEDVPGWADVVRAGVQVLTPREIVAWAAIVEDSAERVLAIGHLAAVAPEVPREIVVDVLAPLVEDPTEQVRGAVLFVCARLAWAEVVPLVEHLHDTEPSGPLRADAARVMAALQEHGVQ